MAQIGGFDISNNSLSSTTENKNKNKTENENKTHEIHDIIILGGGPAGASAGIYASRSNLDVLLITKEIGGQIVDASDVENYPGFITIKGFDLGNKFIEHAKKFGTKIIQEAVLKINEIKDEKTNKNIVEVETESGKKYKGKYLILALGMKRRKLNVPGEEELNGKGVSYCATCDSFFFKDKITAVVGGGNSAVMAAIELAQHAKEVHLFVKEKELMAEPVWIERIKDNDKIKIHFGKDIEKISGEQKLESVTFKDGETMKLDGLFVEVGSEPDKDLINEAGVETDEKGYIKVDKTQRTSILNIFAAGDTTTNSNKLRQVVTAVAEGAIAAVEIFKEIKKKEKAIE